MLALRWPVLLAIAAAFLTFSLLLAFKYYSELKPPRGVEVDVSYACIQLNQSAVNTEQFKLLLYALLTGACNHTSIKLLQPLSTKELEGMAKEFGSRLMSLQECKFPSVNSHSVYTCCDGVLEGKIDMVRRPIINGDVLVCEQGD